MTRRVQRGAGLVATLVGLLIGLVAAVVMLTVFAGSESLKRNAVGAAEVEQTAQLVLATLGADLANAGHTLAEAADDLDLCPDTGNVATTLRPVAVLITAGSNASTSDAFVVQYGAPSAAGASMPLAGDAPAGSPFRVRSALGFAAGDAIVAIGPDGRCARTTATSVSVPDVDGVVTVGRSNASESWPETSLLLTLGPGSRGQRVRYDVVDATLRSLDLTTAGASPNPLASNIVVMKAQYGLDENDDGTIERWASADVAPWDPASVLAAPAVVLAQMKAVRVGIVVKSEVFDRDQSARFTWTLFDCGVPGSACPGRLSGTLPAQWRYRTYETTVPLRNVIWSAR
jgi:type IV pilus assembly protein PilW